MRCGLFDSTAVAEEVNGFPVGNKAQTADFFARYFASFVRSGICGKNESGFQVIPAGGLSVRVLPGEAFLQGYFCFEDEAQTVTFPYSGTAREMTLVLRLDTDMGEIAAKWIPQTQAAGLPLRENGKYDLVLARVDLPEGCEVITADLITDLRDEEDVCGFVRTLSYGGAEKLESPFSLTLSGGCEGSVQMDGSQNCELHVDAVNLSLPYAKGVLPVSAGGTGASSAAMARVNLGAAAIAHDTSPEDLLDGTLGMNVIAANGNDTGARLRNIALRETLPSSLPDGCLCAVTGETGRGLYLFRSGSAIKLAGV